jgi:hypothetical protein
MAHNTITLTAIALVANLGVAGAAHAAWTDSNWTVSTQVSGKPVCVLSSGGVMPDLNNTPLFVNFNALGDRIEVSLGGPHDLGADQPKAGETAPISFSLDQAPADSVWHPQWGINGPDPFLMLSGPDTDQFFAQAAHAKTLHVMIMDHDYAVSLFGFEIALAEFDDCKMRRGGR